MLSIFLSCFIGIESIGDNAKIGHETAEMIHRNDHDSMFWNEGKSGWRSLCLSSDKLFM